MANEYSENLPPEIEASMITVASNWALFVAERTKNKTKTQLAQQFLKDFNGMYHSIYLNVRGYLPRPV